MVPCPISKTTKVLWSTTQSNPSYPTTTTTILRWHTNITLERIKHPDCWCYHQMHHTWMWTVPFRCTHEFQSVMCKKHIGWFPDMFYWPGMFDKIKTIRNHVETWHNTERCLFHEEHKPQVYKQHFLMQPRTSDHWNLNQFNLVYSIYGKWQEVFPASLRDTVSVRLAGKTSCPHRGIINYQKYYVFLRSFFMGRSL